RRVPARGAKDSKVGADCRIVRFKAPRFGERALRAVEIAGLTETGGQSEITIGGRQTGVERGAKFWDRPGTVARLQPGVAETQMRLAIAGIVADDAFERRQQGGAGQLTRRDLRDPRRHLAAVLRIRPAVRSGLTGAAAVAEGAQPAGSGRFGLGSGAERCR